MPAIWRQAVRVVDTVEGRPRGVFFSAIFDRNIPFSARFEECVFFFSCCRIRTRTVTSSEKNVLEEYRNSKIVGGLQTRVHERLRFKMVVVVGDRYVRFYSSERCAAVFCETDRRSNEKNLMVFFFLNIFPDNVLRTGVVGSSG